MGTCSTIGFRLGNEVRYIFVAHDGFKHGVTLKQLGHAECLNLWKQIGIAEEMGQKVWLEHLYSDDVLPVLDWGNSLQKSPRTPIVATEKNWSKAYLETQGFQLSGVIKIETNWPKKVSPVDMMHLIDMEGTVWLYDLDNDKVFFMGDPDAAEYLEYNHKIVGSGTVSKKHVEF